MRVASGPDPPGSSRCVFERRRTSVSRVCLSATLATPASSGSTDTPWLCRGRLPPIPAPPMTGCPQLHRPAATGRRRRSLTSTQSTSASRRTGGRTHLFGLRRTSGSRQIRSRRGGDARPALRRRAALARRAAPQVGGAALTALLATSSPRSRRTEGLRETGDGARRTRLELPGCLPRAQRRTDMARRGFYARTLDESTRAIDVG